MTMSLVTSGMCHIHNAISRCFALGHFDLSIHAYAGINDALAGSDLYIHMPLLAPDQQCQSLTLINVMSNYFSCNLN